MLYFSKQPLFKRSDDDFCVLPPSWRLLFRFIVLLLGRARCWIRIVTHFLFAFSLLGCGFDRVHIACEFVHDRRFFYL